MTPTTSDAPAAPRRSEPRERLLRTASELFYAKGIHSVGVDEVLAEAGVTRATLYRHFRGKEELVLRYLETFSAMERSQVEALLAAEGSPATAVRSLAEAVVEQIRTPGFRGCAFLNAAAEFPDSDQRVHRTVLAHRTWYAAAVTGAVSRLGTDASERSGALFVMLRDGAMAAGCLANPDEVVATFRAGVEQLLDLPASD